ncbi:MAG: carbamoyltransferase HypF, partial [Lentisphaerota bacterium]
GQAVMEPRRCALSVLVETLGADAVRASALPGLASFTPGERDLLISLMEKKIQAPLTSSVGRLFDAAAALAGFGDKIRFEGQAAMELEFSLHGVTSDDLYPFEWELLPGGEQVVDWRPLFRAILGDLEKGQASGLISARFHNTLTEVIIRMARAIGEKRVVLSGGCFQNKYLTERAVRRLKEEGFLPFWHRETPPHDGCIALGQAAVARNGGNNVSGNPG